MLKELWSSAVNFVTSPVKSTVKFLREPVTKENTGFNRRRLHPTRQYTRTPREEKLVNGCELPLGFTVSNRNGIPIIECSRAKYLAIDLEKVEANYFEDNKNKIRAFQGFYQDPGSLAKYYLVACATGNLTHVRWPIPFGEKLRPEALEIKVLRPLSMVEREALQNKKDLLEKTTDKVFTPVDGTDLLRRVTTLCTSGVTFEAEEGKILTQLYMSLRKGHTPDMEEVGFVAHVEDKAKTMTGEC